LLGVEVGLAENGREVSGVVPEDGGDAGDSEKGAEESEDEAPFEDPLPPWTLGTPGGGGVASLV